MQQPAATTVRNFRTFLLMEQFAAQEIGERIREARLERGLTHEELAALTSFSTRSLSDYERGITIPYKHINELARILRRPPEWFLHGNPELPLDETRIRDIVREELAPIIVALEAIEARLRLGAEQDPAT